MWAWMLLLIGCGPKEPDATPSGLAPALAERLQSAIDAARVDSGAPGAQVTVLMPDGSEGTLVSGLADRANGLDVGPADRFRIGSITKSFVAAVALQLHDEGAFDLDAPVSDVLPDLAFADQMTLRQNLTHTAGWDDYAWQGDLVCCMTREWTPHELIELVSDELLFEPGTGFSYANTGYAVVGLAIEEVVGHDYAVEVIARMVDPVGLEDTFLPTHEGLTDGLVRGYLGPTDVSDQMSETIPWTSGEIVSTSADIAHWGHALYLGDALSGGAKAALLDEAVLSDGSGSGYSPGTYLETIEGRDSVGHSGSTMGFQSRLRVVGDGDDAWVVSTMVNDFTAEADVIDAAVWAILLE